MTTDLASPPAAAVTDVTVVAPEVLPTESNLTGAEAADLDAAIDQRLAACDTLLRTYLETGHLLARMKRTKGYLALDCKTWGEYLAKKQQFGRTFLSFLLKLGQAGDPASFLDLEMPPSVLIHYVRSIGYPEKVHDAIAATWSDFKSLPIKEAEQGITRYVEKHAADLKKPRKRRETPAAATMPHTPPATSADAEEVVAPAAAPTEEAEVKLVARPLVEGAVTAPMAPLDVDVDWGERFEAEYQAMSIGERARFILAMEDFIERKS